LTTKAIWKIERPANASIPDNAAGWDAILDALSITLLSTVG
jgi:hypothetical protein